MSNSSSNSTAAASTATTATATGANLIIKSVPRAPIWMKTHSATRGSESGIENGGPWAPCTNLYDFPQPVPMELLKNPVFCLQLFLPSLQQFLGLLCKPRPLQQQVCQVQAVAVAPFDLHPILQHHLVAYKVVNAASTFLSAPLCRALAVRPAQILPSLVQATSCACTHLPLSHLGIHQVGIPPARS